MKISDENQRAIAAIGPFLLCVIIVAAGLYMDYRQTQQRRAYELLHPSPPPQWTEWSQPMLIPSHFMGGPAYYTQYREDKTTGRIETRDIR